MRDRVWDDVASPDLDGRALQLTFALRDVVARWSARLAAVACVTVEPAPHSRRWVGLAWACRD